MRQEYDFTDIRPYFDSEVPDAIKRIINNPQFHIALQYLFTPETQKEILEKLKKVKTSFEFQKVFMLPAMNSILQKTSAGLTSSGTEYLTKGKPGVFLSNHRDILLDSALLQVILFNIGFGISQIASGDNLMISDFVVDLCKVNGIITVFREGSPREVLANSQKLSAYIRHIILERKISVWIAQRKGRTKNGLDKTETAVLKMLTYQGSDNVIETLREINIIPVSISYEWEPCEILKVKEVYYSKREGYVKDKNEDFKSIINGIINEKGRIHISICKPVNSFIDSIDPETPKNALFNKVAEYIDRQIYSNYHLWPVNYLAYDLKFNTGKYRDKYDEKIRKIFAERLDNAVKKIGKDKTELTGIFIDLYANPVIAKESLNNTREV